MSGDQPLAYFITWTVYGTHLQGDPRWWKSRDAGTRPPQPLLERWHRDRLRHAVILLDDAMRVAVSAECKRLSEYRSWKLWAANARTNHVHVVVTSGSHTGKQVRDQLKANCTRVLRESFEIFNKRPVWTAGGDWKCLNSQDDLEQTVTYVTEAQDRMGRGK